MEPGKKRRPWRRFERIVSATLLVVFGLVFLVFLLIQTPPVQNLARKKLVNYLERKLETKVEIGHLRLGFGKLSLGDLYLEDRRADTLLSGGDAVIRMNVLKLLLNNELDISSIVLKDFTANVRRTLPDTSFNFQFIIDAFARPGGTARDTGMVSYTIPNVEFHNIHFRYEDVVSGLDTRGVLEKMATGIDSLDVVNRRFDFPYFELEGLEARFYQNKPIVFPSDDPSDTAAAFIPSIEFGVISLKDIDIDFQNHVSSLYSRVRIGELQTEGKTFDLASGLIDLSAFSLANSDIMIRLGDTRNAEKLEREIVEETEKIARKTWEVRIADLDLRNNHLRFDNDNKKQQRGGIDYAHMEATDFNLRVEDFVLSADSIGGRIIDASFHEKSGFNLETLRGNALYSDKTIFLEDLYLKTPGTELKRYARLDYASPDALANDFPATQMDVDISNSYVRVSDILAFAPSLASRPAFSNPDDTWQINLQGSGSLRSFHIEELQFAGFRDTRLDVSGSFAIGGNTNAGGTLQIRRLHTTNSDLAMFVPVRGNFRFPNKMDISGQLKGGPSGIQPALQIATSSGNLVIEGSMNRLNNPSSAKYDLSLHTSNLDLGYILMDPQLGRISTDMQVRGTGLEAGSLDADFRGRIHKLGYNDYTYSNIFVSGSAYGSSVQVHTDIRDPNLDVSGDLVAQLSGSRSFQFNGFIDSAKLQALGLSKNPVVVRGKIEADVPVISNETLEADVMVTDALLVSVSQRLALDTVSFIASRDDSIQHIRLNSDVANAQLRGQFRFGELSRMFRHALQPYFGVSGTRSVKVTQPYSLSFSADFTNVPILADFIPGLNAFEPLHVEGTLSNTEGLNAVASTQSLDYNGTLLQGLRLSVATTSSGLGFNADVQRFKNNTLDLHHTNFSGVALDNRLDFRLAMDDAVGTRRYFVSGILEQPQSGNYSLRLHPDSLLLNYQAWSVSPGNSITFTGSDLRANNFTLSRGQEVLSLQSNGDVLNAEFSNFQLSTITAFLKSDSILANGRMTGNVAFRNILRQPVFTSNLNIADLSIRGDTLGNASIRVSTAGGNRYSANATITGRGNDVQLAGSFAPSGDRDIALDLDLAIRQLQLSTVEGALGGFLRNSSGAVRGNVSIKGSLANPRISGPLRFDNASFALNILGSQFRIDGEELMVTENGFRFDDFVIRDTANRTMRLNGYISTTDFAKYKFDLDVKADRFQVMNNTKKESKIYYGSLVVSTDLSISGTSDQPVVDGAIVVDDGTELTLIIPQREPGIISREGIVEFVNMDNPAADTLFRAYDSLNVASFRGLDITTNIEIRKEAIFNIVVDEANGDFLNVQGEAQITTGIDPSGKITMVGNYVLERGAYEISFNFLRRRFEIQRGSSIRWFNEPTRAELDVNAVYVANTSPIELVQQQIEAATPAIRNTYLQRLPFEVRLKLTGELLQPNIAFDIVLPENRSYGVSNDIITQVESRLAQVRSDPGETNKQVFALLLLNRFVGENPLESSQEMFSGSRYVRQSVSRLLTEQLNQLAAGLIDGVDLRFDVTTTEDYTTGERRSRTDLNIGLSKQLLNERLTVSVGTDFEIEGDKPVTAGANNNNGSTIGNLSVEYALTRDRRYLIRFYRKNEYQGVVDGYIIESGLSFMISVDYERFRELITRRKKQKVEGVR